MMYPARGLLVSLTAFVAACSALRASAQDAGRGEAVSQAVRAAHELFAAMQPRDAGVPDATVALDAQSVEQQRRNLMSAQATRAPFGPPNGLPILPAAPHESKRVCEPAPSDERPEGQPLEVRPPIHPTQRATFPGQTRAPAHRTKTKLSVRVVAHGLAKPWGLAFLDKRRALVTEKVGAMRILDTATGKLSRPLFGLPPIVYDNGEGGLLDVVLDPAFANNRKLYFSFVGYRPDGNALMIVSARLSKDDSRLADLTQVLTLPSYNNVQHIGGRLLMGPDGKVYLGVGERLSDNVRLVAQDPKSPLGKILRINLDGSVPVDNPYAKVLGADPTVYTLGHRDVQGFAVHPRTHALWVTDHGPQAGDEIDIVYAGHNYGWPLAAYGLEYDDKPVNGGSTTWPGTEQPIYYWDPAIAPSGATFYSGEQISEWNGDLFVAALCGKYLSHLVVRNDRIVGEERLLQDQGQRMRSVVQGPDGALWVVTEDKADGRVIRISAAH